LRYLAALVVSRLAMNGIARLVNAYRAAQQPTGGPPPARSRPDSEPAPKRRRDDNGDPTSLAA
jgi:hypothetical protein